jgi:hypothetical protein
MLDASGQGEAVKNKTIETLASTITTKPSEKEQSGMHFI